MSLATKILRDVIADEELCQHTKVHKINGDYLSFAD